VFSFDDSGMAASTSETNLETVVFGKRHTYEYCRVENESPDLKLQMSRSASLMKISCSVMTGLTLDSK
jgi:hypothetical protein